MKRSTIHHESLLCAPSRRTRYPSTSSFEHNVTCEPCRIALQKKRDDADAKWKAQHALPAHPAWPLIQAQAARLGWPVSYPDDLRIDGDTLATMEPSIPFAWLVTEMGTHLIDPMRFDQDGRRRPPDTALALLRACWPTPSKANGHDSPEDASGLWYWWDGRCLERVHSLRDLQDRTRAAAEEWVARFEAARLVARLGLRTLHEDMLIGDGTPQETLSWIRRNEPTFWRLVANPSARRLHDDPREVRHENARHCLLFEASASSRAT